MLDRALDTPVSQSIYQSNYLSKPLNIGPIHSTKLSKQQQQQHTITTKKTTCDYLAFDDIATFLYMS